MLLNSRRQPLFPISGDTSVTNKKPKRSRISSVIKEALTKARSGISNEANEILEHKGGLAPDYGFKERIEYNEKVNLWSKISSYVSSNNTNFRMNNTIKERKGQEELIKLIMASPHKEVLLKNPNILK